MVGIETFLSQDFSNKKKEAKMEQVKLTQLELTKVLHHIIKEINDSRGVSTAEYDPLDYKNMFDCKSPEENHNSWMQTRINQGWVYGLEKSLETKTSPCLVPYNELPESEKIKDYITQGIINYSKEIEEAKQERQTEEFYNDLYNDDDRYTKRYASAKKGE